MTPSIKRLITRIAPAKYLFLVKRALFLRNIKKKLLQEAERLFEEERPQNGSLKNYKQALDLHLASYSEYMHQYRFWELNPAQQNEFICRNALRIFYLTVPRDIKDNFWNKPKFLKLFSSWIHRRWIVTKEATFEEFCDLVSQTPCIIKPLDSCCGVGIKKIPPLHAVNLLHIKGLYEECRTDNYLLEEAIEGCEEIQAFHPDSLNTIRVVTINASGRPIVFGAFIRMGVGDCFVDNAHMGGLFAQINVETGMIESDGISTFGARYKAHPDTGKQIFEFQIPRWEEIKNNCIEASKVIPQNPIIGWDVVINRKGRIEFVEGNHGPDFDVMQSPLRIGVKHKLNECLGGALQTALGRLYN